MAIHKPRQGIKSKLCSTSYVRPQREQENEKSKGRLGDKFEALAKCIKRTASGGEKGDKEMSQQTTQERETHVYLWSIPQYGCNF